LIGFFSAKIAWTKGNCSAYRGKIRRGISKQSKAAPSQPVEIWRARKFIDEQSSEELSLTKVAKVVNISANYLSEKFKRINGRKFCGVCRAHSVRKGA